MASLKSVLLLLALAPGAATIIKSDPDEGASPPQKGGRCPGYKTGPGMEQKNWRLDAGDDCGCQGISIPCPDIELQCVERDTKYARGRALTPNRIVPDVGRGAAVAPVDPDCPRMGRGAAAAPTWIVSRASRRRRGADADQPACVAAPRRRPGSSRVRRGANAAPTHAGRGAAADRAPRAGWEL